MIGANVKGDATRYHKSFGIKITNLVDVLTMARQLFQSGLLTTATGRFRLDDVADVVLNLKLRKDDVIRLSFIDGLRVLNAKQQNYLAMVRLFIHLASYFKVQVLS